jgi:hypothetical protein
MNILKTNGKPASNKIHLLADVVMETSQIISWELTDSMKKEFLLSKEGTPWELKELEEMCEDCLNRAASVYLALISWYSGSNGDLDLDFDSLQEYFKFWGLSEEV